MLSVEIYIEKANICRNFVMDNRMGVPYIYGDDRFKEIKENILNCISNGCKAILTKNKLPIPSNRDEVIQFIRNNHEIGSLLGKALHCMSEWEYYTLNRNDYFAEQWLHDVILWLRDFCDYLDGNYSV